MYMYMYIYIYICMYVCMHVCMQGIPVVTYSLLDGQVTRKLMSSLNWPVSNFEGGRAQTRVWLKI